MGQSSGINWMMNLMNKSESLRPKPAKIRGNQLPGEGLATSWLNGINIWKNNRKRALIYEELIKLNISALWNSSVLLARKILYGDAHHVVITI